jgi:hypothetical protein
MATFPIYAYRQSVQDAINAAIKAKNENKSHPILTVWDTTYAKCQHISFIHEYCDDVVEWRDEWLDCILNDLNCMFPIEETDQLWDYTKEIESYILYSSDYDKRTTYMEDAIYNMFGNIPTNIDINATLLAYADWDTERSHDIYQRINEFVMTDAFRPFLS